jgi:hypothetical protein
MHTATTNTIWKHRVPKKILKFRRFFLAMHLPVHYEENNRGRKEIEEDEREKEIT